MLKLIPKSIHFLDSLNLTFHFVNLYELEQLNIGYMLVNVKSAKFQQIKNLLGVKPWH